MLLTSLIRYTLHTAIYRKLWENRYKKVYFGKEHEIGLPHVAPPYNMTIYKGSCYGVFSWKFVEYMLEDRRAREYLTWCKKILIPDEMFWNSLNFNPQLNAPGGYIGMLQLLASYSLFCAFLSNCYVMHFYSLCCSQ